MYSNYFLPTTNPYGNGDIYFQQYPNMQYTYDYSRIYQGYPHYVSRQQAIRGQATWTDGGRVTKCGIPWSYNEYMTAAVGDHSPYKCGQTLKIRNLSTPGSREIIVTVVDHVASYPPNKINLHRNAFEALGASINQGVIPIEIIPSPDLSHEKWGKYLLEVAQTAYPGFNVVDYKTVGKTQMSPERTRETFDFILQSPQESIKVRGTVIYNPKTNRVISFDLQEV
ncbi:DUF3889 domain-containing protein [Ferdinandcohnia quinoae]|uniref:DUF3889 domain-containing protein n=1 Tax=Fredinandcohnia quinoae TaxID=2918902 RepID=A0AAW5E621_9BACI|nr:DUF3889 domain-containing protein [Fredinandcohnia sp. SECRCQ15]MCH1624573.1 DUF3889 domain-containing protein [Fredinandcohnia sp. SECRCQ15]